MRLIKLLVDEDQLDTVLDILDEENIDFVVTKDATTEKDSSLVEFPLPTQAVEFVLGKLRDAGVDDREYTIIGSAETAKTEHYHELEDRFVAGVEEDDSVAKEEIRAKALDMYRNALTYYSLTAFSAIVAAAGLLLDSPAVVVGAMVIAPQVGSALIASVGMVLDDTRMMKMGVRTQIVGFTIAIVGAVAFGGLLKLGGFVPNALDVTTVGQISKRISPGLLSVSVAFCAGAAGAFGLATALPVSLVGVMIAAALVPAAAAVGIGIAWGMPSVAVGAFLLLVVNAVAVNLSGFVVLWYLGYRPDSWGSADVGAVRRYAPTAGALVILVGILAVAGGVVGGNVALENDVNHIVTDAVTSDEYAQLSLVSVQTEVSSIRMLDETPTVSVVVSRPTGEEYPDLASDLRQRIESSTGEQVIVEIQYQDRSRSTPGAASLEPRSSAAVGSASHAVVGPSHVAA
ncbi:TIGR00341 family protein [Halomarina salina]|uniref:TIGR00341 family protein n=1 Tax=Halomarina salina TaxID=1872699 RepID=A0ABD5RRX9_9EURY|nr:TIGR00341 family protein [Halomarina salina]